MWKQSKTICFTLVELCMPCRNQNSQKKNCQAWDAQTYRVTNTENEPQISRFITKASQVKLKLSNKLRSNTLESKRKTTNCRRGCKAVLKLQWELYGNNSKFKSLPYSLLCQLFVGDGRREGAINLHLSSFFQTWGEERGSLTKLVSTNQTSAFEWIISIY